MGENETKPRSGAAPIPGIVLGQAGALALRVLDMRLARTGRGRRGRKRVIEGKGPLSRLAAAALVRLATRSVPGALAVSGLVAASALLDRRRQRKAGSPSRAAVDDTGR